MLEWMLMPYSRYAEFSGRSRRKEYWMYTLFTFLVMIPFGIMMFAGMPNLAELGDPAMAASTESPGALFWVGVVGITIFALGSFIPSIAVTVRRFHDRDMSGWWLLGFALLSAIPYVGWLFSIVQIVIMALAGTPGSNRFGPDPKDPGQANVFA